jgi:hypothetical protein
VRLPVKISEDLVPRAFRGFVPNRANPGRLVTERAPADRLARRAWFSRNVAGLLVGGTWRSTAPGRHQKSDQLLLDHAPPAPSILDIGISDGITSLELLDRIGDNFTAYFATDRLLDIEYIRAGRRIWFFHDSQCVAASSYFFTAYAETDAAIPPLGVLARRLTRDRRPPDAARRLSLIQPELVARAKADPRIEIREYDLFSPWTGPQPDIIKVGNVLNRAYFSDDDIRRAVAMLRATLSPEGLLHIIDNRGPTEQSTLFRKSGTNLVAIDSIGRGTDIFDLVSAA